MDHYPIGRTAIHRIAALSLAVLSSALAQGASPVQTPEEDEEVVAQKVSDPLEGFNRVMFSFNNRVYDTVAKPVAKGYETAVPEAARIGIDNVFENLLYPVRLVGSLLQGKVGRATSETGKFLLNSTVGVGGFVKVSDEFPALADVPSEDVGQAIGAWGVPHGPYLVLPILGPTTTRDLVGRFGDRAATPWNWDWWRYYEWEWATAGQVGSAVSGLPSALNQLDATRRAAADPYVSVRNGYVQFRDAQTAR